MESDDIMKNINRTIYNMTMSHKSNVAASQDYNANKDASRRNITAHTQL